jgi:hypothetical protein
MSFEVTRQELLKQAIALNKLWLSTRNQEYKDQETRIRRIVVELESLVIGTSNVTNLDSLSDVTISAPANAQVLAYNSTTSQWENQTPGGGGGGGDMYKSTYDVDNDGVVDSAETTQIIVRNSTGVTLTKGQVVYLSGATGNRPNAVLSKADTEATSSKTIGIVVANIANNSDGYVATNGTLHNLNTSAFADGAAVWLSATTAGAFTSTVPAEPNHAVFIGYIARSHPTQGRILLHIQNGYEFDELHGVLLNSPANNDLVVYETSSGLWKNKSISTIFGGTPLVSVPTLDQVTTAGNTTTNAITVGNLTSVLAQATASDSFAEQHNNTGGSTTLGAFFNVRRTKNAAAITNDMLGGIRWFGATSGTAWVEAASIKVSAIANTWGTAANRNSLMRFFTINANSYDERMRITNDGNLLIGTTTNGIYKLDVVGQIRGVSGVSEFKFNTGAGAITPTIATGNNDVSGKFAALLAGTAGAEFNFDSSGWFSIAGDTKTNYTNNNLGSGSESYFLRIQGTTGNIQIGTTVDAGYKLDVVGTARIQNQLTTIGSITAATAIARGVYFNNTLVAAANNDVLVGLDINPTFTNGAFTGVSNIAFRSQGLSVIEKDFGLGSDSLTPLFTVRKSSTSPQSLSFGYYTRGTTGTDSVGIGMSSSYMMYLSGATTIGGYSSNGNFIFGSTPDGAGYVTGTNVRLGGITFGVGTAPTTISSATFGPAVYLATLTTGAGDLVLQARTAATNKAIYLVTGGATATTAMVVFASTNVAIGTTTDAGYKLDVNGTFRTNNRAYVGEDFTFASSQSYYLLNASADGLVVFTNNSGSTVNQAVGFVSGELYLNGANAFTNHRAINVVTTSRNTSTSNILRAFYASGRTALTGAANTVAGFLGGVNIEGSGNVTNAIGLEVELLSQTNNKTITNMYGLKIQPLVNSVGTITNTYGIYIDSLTAGTQTNAAYGIYQAGTDKNYFGGNVGIGTTNPTSKLDVVGDINTSGVFRVGGVGGWTGTINIPLNPPGQQNIQVAGGIIVNVS